MSTADKRNKNSQQPATGSLTILVITAALNDVLSILRCLRQSCFPGNSGIETLSTNKIVRFISINHKFLYLLKKRDF